MASNTRTVVVDFDRESMDEFTGLRVQHTCWDGTVLTGVVESWHGTQPVIRFADGRWAFGESRLHVVEG